MPRTILCLLLALLLTAETRAADPPTLPKPASERESTLITIAARDFQGRIIFRDVPLPPELAGRIRRAANADRRTEEILRAAFLVTAAGPPADLPEGRPALTPAIRLDRVRVEGITGGFYLTIPGCREGALSPEEAQDLSDIFLGLAANVETIRHHVLMIRDADTGEYRGIGRFVVRPLPAATKEYEATTPPGRTTGQPPADGQPHPSGYLAGKSIFVNPGHGWYYDSGLGRWATQRGNTNNIIEDLSNAESIDTYLVTYLVNAGAGVYTCRERDLNALSVVIDDGDPGYSETGTWTTISSGSAFGGSYRRAATATSETATAIYTPTIPSDGWYHVYIWYVNGSLHSSATAITIRHAGGATTVNLSQVVDGSTYKDIGRYYFHAGTDAAEASVTISNSGADSAHYVVADAVRFGGGTGSETPFSEPFPSGWPRFEEAGPYHAAYMGCPASTCGSSRVTAMPRYAAWENEAWEDSIYVSRHSNAGTGSSRGISSFAYGSGGWDSPFDGVPGGLELRDSVHAELINDFRAVFDPAWNDRGRHTNWYGEINPSYNPEMPGALFEIAFHDNPTDAAYLADPYFRMVSARAIYQGIVKYFAARDGDPNYTLLPEPPTHLRAVGGSGGITLTWSASPFDTGSGVLGDAPAGYRVYRSFDGFGYDDGTAVTGLTYTDTAVPAGTIAYYRVTAVNAGGESFPTATVAARSSGGSSSILIVDGYDRMDRGLTVIENDPYSSNDLYRGYVARMNAYDYIRFYAEAVAAYGADFDSAANEAVADGMVNLSDYSIVVWYTGQESTVDHTFSAAEQGKVNAFLTSGGDLFVSGAEIGWDLDFKGNGSSFYNGALKASYAGDDAGTYAFDAVAGSIFDGNPAMAFDDGTGGGYDVRYPDWMTALGGASAALTYSGGSGGTAGIQYDGADYRLVHFGFPFEAIIGAADRATVMADILAFFGAPAGSACGSARPVTSYPFTDSDDTSGGTRVFSGYSCPPSAGSEAGPEVLYALTISQPGDLTVSVSDGLGVDIDPHLLSTCDPASCLARADTTFTINVPPGDYFLVCDTWTSSGGTEYPGPYSVTITFSPTPGDTISPAAVSDLQWSNAGTAWTWSAVTLDRLGSSENVDHYDLFRSTDPSTIGVLIGQPTGTSFGDAAQPSSGGWYYRLYAVDASGNRSEPDLDRIVDNGEASFQGTWQTGTTTPGHWGTDYRYHDTGGSGTETAQWSFMPWERGFHTIQLYYPEGGNRSTEARFSVLGAGGSHMITVDQQVGGGTWNTLTTLWLEAGTACTVTLDDAEPAGWVVIADAVRFYR